MSNKVYQIVTDKIIEKLEQGTIPWRKPWNCNPAMNWESKREYTGINAILLDPGEYATFNQIKKAGGKVKKGEKSHLVVFWKLFEKKSNNKDDDKIEKIPFLRYYNVFEINKQCEGLESRKKDFEDYDHNPITDAENIVKLYKDSPKIKFSPNRAYYSPIDDFISVPEMKDFEKIEEYYSTLFHEMIHSTGHKSRLNRQGITDITNFGSETYSKEELVAEIGSAMLCGKAKIENATIDNSASYIQSWLRKLKNDHKLIVIASSQAQKAANYILNIA